MPIYEFDCRECRTRFDELCRIGQTDGIACPQCGSDDVKRLVSMFSSRSSGGDGGGSCSCGSSGGCGGDCGGCGNCTCH